MAACTDGSCVPRHLSRKEKRKEFEHDPANPEKTWKGLRDDMIGLSDQYFNHGTSTAELEENLHDPWDELIHAAKITPADSPEHDRLVTLILEARELGPVARRKDDNDNAKEEEAAALSNGQHLWPDLPCLVQEFQDVWAEESIRFTAAEREGLAVLTAKLCTVGICPTELGHCALWLFKEALETERPLISTPTPTTTLSGGEDSRHSIVDLLPACLAWLRYANFKLAKLSVASQTASHPVLSVSAAPGALAIEAGITQLYGRGDGRVSKMARACFEEAVLTGLRVGLEIPGEKKYLERLFEALDKEMAARGFSQCVGPEDIEIDMDWAES